MQNLVTVCHNMTAYVGGPPIFFFGGGQWNPPLGIGVISDPLKTSKFGSSSQPHDHMT